MKKPSVSDALTAFADALERLGIRDIALLGKRSRWEAPGDDQVPLESAPVRTWSTKGTSFWALLSAILIKAQPESILELGGGRSTTFLAEYAHRYRRPSLTIESSSLWCRKLENDLRFMNITGKFIEHVPLRKEKPVSWYDPDLFLRALGGRTFDLLFVDGPSGESRCHEKGQAILREIARDARMIIVDDTHRDYNVKFFQDVSAKYPKDCIFAFRSHNLLHIGVDPEWKDIVAECFTFLGLDPTGERRAEGPKLKPRRSRSAYPPDGN